MTGPDLVYLAAIWVVLTFIAGGLWLAARWWFTR